ncbi:MAG: serine/threonine protein kinase [Deltaproteobacteria bacterium]|nr:serine/threonine protein kinase [Deltaproteobacteria bacterium]
MRRQGPEVTFRVDLVQPPAPGEDQPAPPFSSQRQNPGPLQANGIPVAKIGVRWGMLCAHCWEATTADPCSQCGKPARLDGRYRLQAILGDGRSGTTWRGVREADGEVCVIKELPFRRARTPKERQLIEREANVLRQLSNPGIPRLYETFLLGKGPGRALCIVEEFVDGMTLNDEMATHRFEESEVIVILEDLLAILQYLHGLSPPVIHRDIKPQNVMRAGDGHLVLVDFGAVRDVIRDPDLGGSTVAGTFGYMAPEQFSGDANPGSDLYGVGALAVALLTRREPHTLQDWAQRTRWREHAQVSDGLANVLSAMLTPNPEARPTSAIQVRSWLHHLQRPPSTPSQALRRAMMPPAFRPRPPGPPPERPSSHQPRPVSRVRELLHHIDDLRETRLMQRPKPRLPASTGASTPLIWRHLLLGALFLLVAFFSVAGATMLSGVDLSPLSRASVPTLEVDAP